MITKIIFGLMVVLIASFQATAGANDTEKALNFLLAASNMTIPPTSSCSGLYGQKGPPKLKHLLAMRFAGFNRGQNTITGACQGTAKKSCSVSISHRYGEDVYGAEIRFQVNSEGAIDVNTLTCIMD
jgi:hypothetical protein